MTTGNGDQIVRLPAVVTVEHDDLGEIYVARCLAVEVASHGDTHEEALANLREALELYFEDSPVPEMDANPELALVDVRIPARPSFRPSRERRSSGRWNEPDLSRPASRAVTASCAVMSGI